MIRFLRILLLFFFTTIRTSSSLRDNDVWILAKKVCEDLPEQDQIITISCNSGEIRRDRHISDSEINNFVGIIICNIIFVILVGFETTYKRARYEKSLREFYNAKYYYGYAHAQHMEFLRICGSHILKADSETTSIVNTNIDENGTEDSQPSNNSNRCDTSIASSLRKHYVPGVSSTKPFNILLETPNGIDEYSSLQHDSADEPESNTMGVSALVENKNDSGMGSPKRGRNQLQKSKQDEKNLSRSVSQESSQSNYSSSTASYSSVRLSENEFHPSVNAFLSFGRTSSAYDLLPNIHEKRNEPSYHQETWEHIDSQISSKNDAFLLHESTIIHSRRHTVIGFKGEYSRISEDLRLNEVKRSCRSISSYQQSYSFLTASHEDISQFSRDRFLPNDAMSYCTAQNGTRTPLSVVFARIDETLRNIGGIRSVQNDEDQSSERSLSMQSDYSFSTASLRSDDASSLGSSVTSSNSNLSNDSGIPNSPSDVEEINE